MDLTQLEVFATVAEEGSVTAAADKLHRVPSNISTRIKQLEEELGTLLFHREKLRLHISDPGKTFLGYAKRILALAEEAKQSVSGQRPNGIFTLGAIESCAAVHIPPVLARYHQAYPDVELGLSTGPSGDMIDGMLAGQFSAAFVDGPPKHPEIEGIPAFDEEMVLISALNHPPVSRARDISGSTIYAFRANCSYRRLFENWFAQDDAVPGKIYEMESYHGIVACVTAGAGLALVPASMLATMPGKSGVKVYPLGDEMGKIKIWLMWRKGAASANQKAMITLLEAMHA